MAHVAPVHDRVLGRGGPAGDAATHLNFDALSALKAWALALPRVRVSERVKVRPPVSGMAGRTSRQPLVAANRRTDGSGREIRGIETCDESLWC
jgi:hypothetical protein